MVLTIMGEIADETINSHFLSKPKIVLHFINEQEDRRIPFVLSNVTYVGMLIYLSICILISDLLIFMRKKSRLI